MLYTELLLIIRATDHKENIEQFIHSGNREKKNKLKIDSFYISIKYSASIEKL